MNGKFSRLVPFALSPSKGESRHFPKRGRLSIRPFRSGTISSALALLAILTASSLSALDVPPLRGRVNDLAGLIPPNRVRALEERLASFEKETGHQIAVLTIPSLEGENREEFSIRVAETWKLGHTGFDNGVLLLIARNDRQLRIEVGYGLEGVLPDALASRIVREVIVPSFRANDFPGGIEAGVEAIMKATRGERLPETARQTQLDPIGALIGAIVFSLFAIAFSSFFFGALFSFFFPRHAASSLKRKILGGVLGGGAAANQGFPLLASVPPWGQWIWMMVMVPVGALLGAWLVQRIWAEANRSGVSRFWSTSRQGGYSSWGSSGLGGSSSSGSSFSGGGGSFGGGGASGSW